MDVVIPNKSEFTRLMPGIVCLVVICLGLPIGAQESKLDQAIDQMARSNYLDASETLETYLDTHPEDAEAWYLLGRSRNRLELYEEAYAALTNAVSYGARTPALNREIGFALQGLERWPAALQYLRKANKDDPEAWLARGQIQLKRKKYKKAKRAVEHVIELETTLDASAYLLLARILALEGKPRLARDKLKKGLRLVKLESMESSYEQLGSLLKLLDQHVFQLYLGIFYRERVNEERGVVTRNRIDEELRERVRSSLESFREETAEPDRSPDTFLQFVRENEDEASTERLFENLRNLFDRLTRLNLSQEQINNLRHMIVQSITPEGTTSEFLVKSIMAEVE